MGSYAFLGTQDEEKVSGPVKFQYPGHLMLIHSSWPSPKELRHTIGFSILIHKTETKLRSFASGGCSSRYLTAQNLQEFLILSSSTQPFVQIVSARPVRTMRGWLPAILLKQRPKEFRQRKLCLSPCTGIPAVNPENCSLLLSQAFFYSTLLAFWISS